MNTDKAPQAGMISELPELPTPGGPWHATSDYEGYYTFTADQMRAYAQAALNARAGGDAERYVGLRAALISERAGEFIDALNAACREPETAEQFDAAIDAALASQAVGVKDGR